MFFLRREARIRTLEWKMDRAMTQIDDLQAAETARDTAQTKVLAELSDSLASIQTLTDQLKAALAQSPPDNSAQLNAILSDIDAETDQMTSAISAATPAPTSAPSDPNNTAGAAVTSGPDTAAGLDTTAG